MEETVDEVKSELLELVSVYDELQDKLYEIDRLDNGVFLRL